MSAEAHQGARCRRLGDGRRGVAVVSGDDLRNQVGHRRLAGGVGRQRLVGRTLTVDDLRQQMGFDVGERTPKDWVPKGSIGDRIRLERAGEEPSEEALVGEHEDEDRTDHDED